jgi:hypothetical protein
MRAYIFVSLLVFNYGSIGLTQVNPMNGRDETMGLVQAEKRWGRSVYKEDLFRSGNSIVRAKMVVDLIEKNPFVGKSVDEVKGRLGKYTGYYWSHRIPAYLIEEGWEKNSDTWQIVFVLDSKGLVKESKIHKNCCYTHAESSSRRPSVNGK